MKSRFFCTVLRTGPTILAIALVVCGEQSAQAQSSETAGDADAVARITSTTSEMRAGPGLSYRVIHRAMAGDTFAIQGRESLGYWVRVYLVDGRTAYLLGDTAEVLLLDELGADSPAPGLFSPPLLESSWGGIMMSGGFFDGHGFAEWRPAFLISKALALEPYVGLILSGEGRSLLYGASTTLNLIPDWAVAPYISLGGGGFSSLPNDDSFVVQEESLFHARAGGGLLISLRYRISLRMEATHTVLFDATTYREAASYVAGLGSYF